MREERRKGGTLGHLIVSSLHDYVRECDAITCTIDRSIKAITDTAAIPRPLLSLVSAINEASHKSTKKEYG